MLDFDLKIRSGQVWTIMSQRSGLREDYADMENELDKFINYDDKFVDRPQF